MIRIDPELCTGCGHCIGIYLETCLRLENGKAVVQRDACTTCTQCIAICPKRAISWEGTSPQPFDRSRLPSPAQLNELFKERRSVRSFRKEKIAQPVLEEITCYGSYAPTMNPALRAVIVDDEAAIARLDEILMGLIRTLYNHVFNSRIVAGAARLLGLEKEFLKAKPKLETAVRNGQALHTIPAAMLFLVGSKNVTLSNESAQYVMANIIYYAQSLGIGSCLFGNAPIFFDRHGSARKLLGLRRGEKIYAGLLLGYPAVKYLNKAEGRTLEIQWI